MPVKFLNGIGEEHVKAERTQHWLMARSNLTDDGRLVYMQSEVEELEKKLFKSLHNKDLVYFTQIGRTTYSLQHLATLNTLDVFVQLLLRCPGNMVFRMRLAAIKHVIDTRKPWKKRWKKI